MFIHNLKYSLKTLFRNKVLIFWTFAFPLILGTFFYMAFSNIESSEKFKAIDIAIIDNEEFSKDVVLKNAINELSSEKSDNKVFNITYSDSENAKKLLADNKIVGYLIIENGNANVTVSKSGIDETIFKSVIEEIVQTGEMLQGLSENKIKGELQSGNYNINYEKIYTDALNIINNQEANLKNTTKSNLDYTMIEFYTLIAMTCLYGGILGTVAINQNLPNISSNGKRVAVTLISKGKLVLGSVLSSYIVQLIGLALLYLYTIFALKVDYGDNLLQIVILSMLGCLAGLMIGIVVGIVVKSNENTKTGIIISITMLGCFLSGMMGITMKYVVDKNIPILNMINPANMITDGLYSLYYYDTLDRYYFNVASLLVFSVLLILVSYISLRRQKYDSI